MDNENQNTQVIIEPAMIYQTAYQYDDFGYYCNTVDVQIAEGVYLPPNTTIAKPELKDGYWYKYDANNDAWVSVKIPTCDTSILAFNSKFIDNSERGYYLRQTMQEFVNANQDYYIDRQDIGTEKELWTVKQYDSEYLFNRSLDAKQSELDIKYQQELSSCTVSVKLSTGKTLTLSTAQSTLQTLSTALTMVQYGNGFDWVGDDGKIYNLSTVDDVISCITAISNHNTSVSKQWSILQGKINKCKTRKALDKIVIDLHEENEEVSEDETE